MSMQNFNNYVVLYSLQAKLCDSRVEHKLQPSSFYRVLNLVNILVGVKGQERCFYT